MYIVVLLSDRILGRNAVTSHPRLERISTTIYSQR